MASKTIPLRLESVANLREHWRRKAKRAREHRMLANAEASSIIRAIRRDYPMFDLPCVVTLTRIAPRKLDSDNMASACKNVRDGIADAFWCADNDPRITWRYAQERGAPKEYALRIEIEQTTTQQEPQP